LAAGSGDSGDSRDFGGSGVDVAQAVMPKRVAATTYRRFMISPPDSIQDTLNTLAHRTDALKISVGHGFPERTHSFFKDGSGSLQSGAVASDLLQLHAPHIGQPRHKVGALLQAFWDSHYLWKVGIALSRSFEVVRSKIEPVVLQDYFLFGTQYAGGEFKVAKLCGKL
jgi:hypothetical protein